MNEPLPPHTGPDDPFGEQVGGASGASTSVLERQETAEDAEPGDHERFAHYVRKNKIMDSALSGKPVIALCGKVRVPGRDPEKFPVCPTCKEIYSGLRSPKDGGPGNDGGPGGSDSSGGK